MADKSASGVPAAPDAPPEKRKVKVKLLNDVWDEDGVRIRTNVPVIGDDGNIVVDQKTKQAVTTLTVVDLDVGIARKMIEAGTAIRMDPL